MRRAAGSVLYAVAGLVALVTVLLMAITGGIGSAARRVDGGRP